MTTAGTREAQRLTAPASYAALDTALEPGFDDLTAAAAQIAGVPSGLVTLLDEHRLWFTATTGLPVEPVDHDIAFCAYTVAANDVVVVRDAQQDPRFFDNPLVTGPPQLRFYAGFPLRTATGHVLGALSVLGPHPTDLDAGQRQLLQVLADQVVNQLERRRLAAEKLEACAQALELTERLARSQQRYRLLAEHATDIVSRHAPDGTVLYVSPSLHAVLGAEPGLKIGEHAQERAHPADRGLLDQALRTVVAGDGPVTVTVRARHADGSWRWLETTLSALLAADDSLLEVYSTARDVTAQQETAAAILLSEQQHRGLFELSPVGLVEADAEGRMLRVNNAFAALVGRSAQELAGQLMRDLVEPLPPGDDWIGARAYEGEDAPGAERVFVRPDGVRVHCVLSCAVVRRTDETVERIVVTVVDITERNVARAELETLVTKLQEARAEADRRTSLLDAVLETIDVGVVACDAAGRLVLFNRASRDFHGLPADRNIDPADWSEHYALRSEDGFTSLDADRVPLHRALVEGDVSDQHVVITPSGLPSRTLRCDGRALRDAEGHVTGAVVAMKDVTELRASEQRFRAAFQNGPTPMARLDPDGTVRDANPALRRFLSVPTSRLQGRRLADLVHPDDATLLTDVLNGPGTGDSPVELRLLRPDGVAVWCELATTNAASVGGEPYVLAQLLDMHERKNHQLLLELAADQDPLTGLGNRQVLDRELARCLATAGGPGATVLFVDLDGFKAVNDQLGHDAGDLVLVQTAERLRAAVRPGDTVTRTGGDEFVVVCPGVKTAGALLLRVEQALSLPVIHHGALLAVGASVGSSVGARGDDPVALVALADQAMYRSKHARRS